MDVSEGSPDSQNTNKVKTHSLQPGVCVNTICCTLQHSEKSLKRRRRLNGHLRSSMWQQQD